MTVAGAQVEAGSAGGGSGCRGLPAGGLTVTHPALASSSGLYVGEGAAPVPKKLADKILRWEFVEMGELLPEFWLCARDDTKSRSRRSRKVTDISTWTRCFATYVSVLGPANPTAIPELMAYLASIVQANQDFDGLVWERYNAAFRRQAAATGNRMWSRVNPSLYTLCFSACVVTKRERCELCLGTTHTAQQCALQGAPDPELNSRVKTVGSVLLAMSQKTSGKPKEVVGTNSSQICHLLNRNNCTFQVCRYKHVCSTCEGSHQALHCPRPAGTVGKVSGQGSRTRTKPQTILDNRGQLGQ